MKNKCDCYYEDRYLADYTPLMKPIYKTVTRCNGTRERDECSCGGDRTKCDFYPEVREKAKREEDCLIVSFDFSPPNIGDVATLVVARRNGDKIEVINELRNSDALDVYDKLIYG